MSTATSELLQFRDFLNELCSSGEREIGPEEAVYLWRLRNRSPEEMAESVAAIPEGLDDIEAGRTVPIEQFMEEFVRDHPELGRNR